MKTKNDIINQLQVAIQALHNLKTVPNPKEDYTGDDAVQSGMNLEDQWKFEESVKKNISEKVKITIEKDCTVTLSKYYDSCCFVCL
jgi:hypothetical protein